LDRIRLLRNPIRHYRWGSRTAIARLQGRSHPTEQPEAELWMGAHPDDPSFVEAGDGPPVDLLRWIERDPVAVLGERVAREHDGALPFLLKVLAAETPLSVQTHPDAERARRGYARENAAGVPLRSARRSYRDPHAKPELICALTPFDALCGFRPQRAVAASMRAVAARAT